jgi:plasmid stabilization system protein ParE
MPRIRWTERGSLDLIRLHAFLAGNSRDAALRAVKTIRDRVKILGTHPEIGRPVPDLPAEVRELVIEFGQGAYILRYRYDGERVFVLAIRHGRETGY